MCRNLQFQEFEEATSVYEDILLTDQERYGENDLVCAIDYHNLGVTNVLAGKLNEAKEHFQESARRKRECLGEYDVSVFVSRDLSELIVSLVMYSCLLLLAYDDSYVQHRNH